VLARWNSDASWKKICGILVEASSGSKVTEWVVLGMGLNVNNRTPPGLSKASSLKTLAKREFDLQHVENIVLSELGYAYGKFLNGSGA